MTVLTHQILENLGLSKNGLHEYYIDVSQPGPSTQIKHIIIDTDSGMGFIREGNENRPRHDDDLIVFWNRDYTGDYTLEQFKALYFAFTGKSLELPKDNKVKLKFKSPI